jgi:hypothetical protein
MGRLVGKQTAVQQRDRQRHRQRDRQPGLARGGQVDKAESQIERRETGRAHHNHRQRSRQRDRQADKECRGTSRAADGAGGKSLLLAWFDDACLIRPLCIGLDLLGRCHFSAIEINKSFLSQQRRRGLPDLRESAMIDYFNE